ncbi:MAG: glycosyltransferase family 4 protein [Pseudohongiellaceae bacterium]|nr:glycosyltransferase family 4 protein [Pseudohongiellaceae bacterium]
MTMQSPVISIVYNTAFYVYKFRVNLIKALQSQGYVVAVISPVDSYVDELKELGVLHYPIRMSQYGMNPFKEMATTWQLFRLFQKLKPVCSLHYTIKPNIFGSLAARFAGVPVINNIAGAGRAFSEKQSMLSRVVSVLYKLALSRSYKVFFQNRDDLSQFTENGLVSASIVERIPGSGVDLERFQKHSQKDDSSSFKFLFIGRLLYEKGVLDFLNAAKRVLDEQHAQNVVFELVGERDDAPGFISLDELASFINSPRFMYKGTVSPDSIPSILSRADCVVLPSYYREGVPRTLLEAAAMGVPIITTDNVGCRDAVDDRVNGYLVPIKNPEALFCAMTKILSLPKESLRKMGAQGRKKMEIEFSEKIVIDAYLSAVHSATDG